MIFHACLTEKLNIICHKRICKKITSESHTEQQSAHFSYSLWDTDYPCDRHVCPLRDFLSFFPLRESGRHVVWLIAPLPSLQALGRDRESSPFPRSFSQPSLHCAIHATLPFLAAWPQMTVLGLLQRKQVSWVRAAHREMGGNDHGEMRCNHEGNGCLCYGWGSSALLGGRTGE